jgi:phosphate transport system protein
MAGLRQAYLRELQRLQDEILTMGSMVEHALTASVEVLKRRDRAGAERLMADDRLINEKRFAIEADTLACIAMQQPAAGDLRVLAAVLEIGGELERMGDYAKGIAHISLMIGEQPLIKPLVDIPRMAVIAREMLHQSLDAFVRRDLALAEAVCARDDEQDALYNQVFRELVTHILEHPAHIEQSNYLLWAAHNMERTSDRVTNICERVIFMMTGQLVDIGDKSTLSVLRR